MKQFLAFLATSTLLFGFSACGSSSESDTSGSETVKSTSRGEYHELTEKQTTITFFTAQADMWVKSVTMDFFPNAKVLSDPKDDGNQFVRVELGFKNNMEEVFKMNYTNVSLDTASAKSVGITFLMNDSNASDLLASKDLAKGETASGALYFEIPATETLENLIISYKGYDTASKEYKISLAAE